MRSDLDDLMKVRGLDAIVVTGDEGDNPTLAYISNGAHITGGYALKRQGAPVLLVVGAMETDEAAKSGLEVRSLFDLGYAQLVEAAKGNRSEANIALFGRLMEAIGLSSGRIGLYGRAAIDTTIEWTRQLTAAYPQFSFIGETEKNLFEDAYLTKDADEIARLRSIGARTSEVLAETWDFIAGHQADGDRVVDAAGAPLTIGMVKRFVRRALLDRDLEDTDMIFAQGRDAGMPHSRGETQTPLLQGQSIVFDLFPREVGGGYFHDCTRTWSIGYATPEVQRAFDEVTDAYDIAYDNFRVNMPAAQLQIAVQDYFESKGHATSRSQPGTTDGYVHSLGHGVGLNIHERPALGHLSKDTLPPGCVISIEPGLYYPDRGFGVRLEDLVYVGGDGQLVNLTDFHKQLVLPLRK